MGVISCTLSVQRVGLGDFCTAKRRVAYHDKLRASVRLNLLELGHWIEFYDQVYVLSRQDELVSPLFQMS